MTTLCYDAEVRHDGRLYAFTIPQLDIPVCRACGAKVFTEKVDQQINAALRSHLHLLAAGGNTVAHVGPSQDDSKRRRPSALELQKLRSLVG